jgi:hypothetical protein
MLAIATAQRQLDSHEAVAGVVRTERVGETHWHEVTDAREVGDRRDTRRLPAPTPKREPPVTVRTLRQLRDLSPAGESEFDRLTQPGATIVDRRETRAVAGRRHRRTWTPHAFDLELTAAKCGMRREDFSAVTLRSGRSRTILLSRVPRYAERASRRIRSRPG